MESPITLEPLVIILKVNLLHDPNTYYHNNRHAQHVITSLVSSLPPCNTGKVIIVNENAGIIVSSVSVMMVIIITVISILEESMRSNVKCDWQIYSNYDT